MSDPGTARSGQLYFNTVSNVLKICVSDSPVTWQVFVTSGGGGALDHGTLSGLGDDDHSQYLLLAGRPLGQTVFGGSGAGESLELRSTSNGTKGTIVVGNSSGRYLSVTESSGVVTMGDGGSFIQFNPANIDTANKIVEVWSDTIPSTKLSISGQGAISTLGAVSAASFSGSGASLTGLNAGNIATGVLDEARGGTGYGSFSSGDMLYASGTAVLSKLAAASTGNVLLSGTAPSWGKVGLTTHVSGTLPVGSGGTGATSLTSGGVVIGQGTSAVVTATGTSTQILIGGTTPAFGPLNLATMTTGTLAVTSGGTGATSLTSKGILYGNGTSAVAVTASANSSILVTDGSGTPSLSTTLPAFTMGGNIAMGSYKITGHGTPTSDSDVATKGYVDAVAYGLFWKTPVRVVRDTNFNLASAWSAGSYPTVDGVATTLNDRVLFISQSTASENGIYVVGSVSFARASDANTSDEVQPGLTVFVSEGTSYGNSQFTLTTDGTITLGTTGLTFTQINGAASITAGTGLSKSGNTLSISASYTGQASITTLGTISSGTWNGTAIGAAYGGTSQTSYTTGDILYATGSTSLGKLADVANGNVLLSGGVGVAPTYGKVGLTTHVSGTLPIGSGGTNATTQSGARTNLSSTANPLPQKYVTDVGDGSTTTFTITHNLGTRSCMVQVMENATYEVCIPDVVMATTNTCQLIFGVPPSTNEYNVTIVG